MISKNYLSILFVSLVSLFLITAKASGATWTTEVVDSGEVGEYTSIAIDTSDNVHISYYDRSYTDLKFATNATGSWVTTTADSDGGSYTSIALDSSGNVHISYNNGDLKYATNATGSWVTTTVDSSAWVGLHTSIALDSSDNVHISYYGLLTGLNYATNATGSWVRTTVDSSAQIGLQTFIALDSSGKVHISYHDWINLDLKYATNATGSWVTTTVDSFYYNGGDTSIALDSSGKVHISYYDGYPNEDLKYATNATGSWVTTTADSDGGSYTSIVLDSSGKVHISYHANLNLKYATNATGSWVTTTVDSSAWVGLHTSIALDSSDNVHISYFDGGINADLKYATVRGSTSPPVPDIKVNGSDGPVTLPDNLSVTVALDPVGYSGDNADWWVAADVSGTSTIDGWYYFDVGTMNWVYAGDSYTDLSSTNQGPLFDLSTFEVLNMSGLPVGTYILYFAVDTNMNGILDFGELFLDSVVVNIVYITP